jgi:hypothetical protein
VNRPRRPVLLSNGRRQILFPGGSQIFQRMYTRLGCEGRPPQFLVEYHPYTDLTHTIRLREDTAHVRLSDVMSHAPLDAVEAAAALLLGRLYRRRVPKELLTVYRKFSYAARTRGLLLAQRRQRARRVIHLPAGEHHDLAPLYQELNAQYFGGSLVQPELGWSTRAWRTLLGCFDAALNQIVINCKLDREGVPQYVVAYVLYHEMLHQKLPARYAECRRQSHPKEFRIEEKRFADYGLAMKFLKKRS